MSKGYYVWNKGDSSWLTDNFNTSEFECPGCPKGTEQRISTDLVTKLQNIRDELGVPLVVTSGFRSAEYQQELRERGLKTARGVSQHELGNAVDVRRVKGLLKAVEKRFKAVGVANTFIHMDTRDDKIRRWDYS